MLALTVRSGVVESRHPGEVVAVDAGGKVVARWGDLGRPFFMRSAAKPFQATVSREHGAVLVPEHFAVACASHAGEPAHVAIVREILARHEVGEELLACPADHPRYAPAADRAAAAGSPLRRIHHNCSGKHAAMLAACSFGDLDPATYTDPAHPLQRGIAEVMADVTGDDVEPAGIDGCQAPTWRVTVTGMARAFARLGGDSRFADAATAMHRYPALTSGTGRPEVGLARAVNGVVKGGAQGCIGVVVPGQLGLAAKSDDGNFEAAVVAVAAALRRLGFVPETSRHGIAGVETIPVLGGGRPVGAIEPALTGQ